MIFVNHIKGTRIQPQFLFLMEKNSIHNRHDNYIKDFFLKWFESYLSGRTQYVVFNGVQSETHSVDCGVPPGLPTLTHMA